MSICEISSPMHDYRVPRCRACKFYGQENSGFKVFAKCSCETNKIKRKHRDHNSKACSSFELANWVNGEALCKKK